MTMMTRVRIGRNDKCPCSSGKKFKYCCLPVQEPRRLIRKPKKGQKGRVQAASALTNEQQAQAILQQRLEQFKQRFGREPGQADRVFFQAPSLDAAVDGISKAMESSEIDPAFVYAFRKTGLIVVSENMAELTGAELQVFQDAADEYRNIKTGEQHAEPQLDHDQ